MSIDSKLKTLSSPIRREILMLLKDNLLCASDIHSHFAVSFATISFHLSNLEKSELVKVQQINRFRVYSLNRLALGEIMEWLVGMT